MNNQMVIGQYIPSNSIIHRLDSRFKLISMIILIVATFLIPIRANLFSFIAMGTMLLIPLVLISLAKIPILRVFAGMRPVVTLLLFTFIMQVFVTSSGDLLFESTMFLSFSSIAAILILIVIYFLIKKYIKFKMTLLLVFVFLAFLVQYFLLYGNIWQYDLRIYSDALIRAGFLSTRLLSVMMIASLLTFTTSTIQLNDGLESLLWPTKLIGLNPAIGAMVMALALRFIPTLMTETNKIMKAQTSRGVDFNESKIKQKVVQVISLLIPIFNISLKRALELADAMEVRGYEIGKKRTKIDLYKIRYYDYLAVCFGLLILGVVIYGRIAL